MIERQVVIEGDSNTPVARFMVNAIQKILLRSKVSVSHNIGTSHNYETKLTKGVPFVTDTEAMVLSHVETTVANYILPNGTVWWNEDKRCLLVRKDPSFKTVKVAPNAKSYGKHKTYTIWVPSLLYGINFYKYIPYVSKVWSVWPAEAKDLGYKDTRSEIICSMPLPNVYFNGSVCNAQVEDANLDAPIEAIINKAFDDFWSSTFNPDVSDFARHPFTTAMGAYSFFEDIIIDDVFYNWSDMSTNCLDKLQIDMKRYCLQHQTTEEECIAKVLQHDSSSLTSGFSPQHFINDVIIASNKCKV